MPEKIIKMNFPSNQNVWWELDTETGLLSIGGRGEIEDEIIFTNGSFGYQGLWAEYNSYVKTVSISFDVQPLTMKNWFYGCENLEYFDFYNVNTEKCNNMSGLFNSCTSLKDVRMQNLDSSKVTDMSYMFYRCKSLGAISINKLDTSKVIDMSYMFHRCEELKSLVIQSIDTSSVTNMAHLFSECSNIVFLDLEDFDTSNVLDMSYMFFNCYRLEKLFSNFETQKLKRKEYIFTGCNKLPADQKNVA